MAHDERREFIDEMRAESRPERELFAMVCVFDGDACLDRLSQMFDWDDFDDESNEILEAALAAEDQEDASDYERARGQASEFINDAIAGYLAKEAK